MQNRRIINHELVQAGVPISPRIESNSMIALVAHVLTGDWVSIVNADTAMLFAARPGTLRHSAFAASKARKRSG